MPTEDPRKDPLSGAQTGRQPGHIPFSQQDILDPETEKRLRKEKAERAAAIGRVRDELSGLCRSLAPAGSMGPLWWAQKLPDGANLRFLSIEAVEDRRRMVVPFSRMARLDGDVPVCVLYSRASLSPPDAEAVVTTSELPKSKLGDDALLHADASLSGQLHEFVESLEAAEKDGSFRVVLVADAPKLQYFGVRQNPFLGSVRHAGLWNTQGILKAIDDLASRIEAGIDALFPFLLQISKECDRRWMLDSNGVLSAAARSLFDAAGEVDLSAATAPGAEDLLRIQGVWEVARTEVKGRLEAVIKKLAQEPLSTFEEKRDLAAMLMQAIDRWGFRPKSPHTGNPSILRVRQTRGAETGTYQFDEIPSADQDVPSSRRTSRGATAQVPVFELTDRPTDRRRRKS